MKTNKIHIAGATLVVAMIVAGALLHAAPPPPTVGALTVTPAYVVVNTPTQVTFSIQITNPNLLPNGVNLLKVDASGRTVATIGVMHDDGLDSDLTAHDQVFTYSATLNALPGGQFMYRVSAAFRGILQRATSQAFEVYVSTNTVGGLLTSSGGTVAGEGLSYVVEPGIFNTDVRVSLRLGSIAVLPVSFPDAPVNGIVQLGVVPATSADTSTLEPSVRYATVTIPLAVPASPNTQLLVLEPTSTGDNWKNSGQLAMVSNDGRSATFRAATDGWFVLLTPEVLRTIR